MTLIASTTLVRAVDGAGREVARHARSWDRGQVVQDDAHLEALAKAKQTGRALVGRERLRHHCPAVEPLLQAIADRNQPIRPQTARLNRLLDRYGAERLEQAIQEVLERQTPSAASVAHVLDRMTQDRGEAPPLQPIQHFDPRVRDLRVKPHDLGSYDHLARHDPEVDDG